MKIKVVSLDVWNTLLNLDIFLKEIAKQVAEFTGSSPEELYKKLSTAHIEAKNLRRKGVLKEDIVQKTEKLAADYLGTSADIFQRAVAKAVLTVNTEKLVAEGAYGALKELSKVGLKKAVLGNVLFWPGSYTRLLLERTELASYIEAQFYADEVGYQKPQKEFFELILKRFSVSAEEAIHVGDGLYEDFAGAILSGFYAALILPNVKDIVSLGAKAYAIPSIKYLPKLISRIS